MAAMFRLNEFGSSLLSVVKTELDPGAPTSLDPLEMEHLLQTRPVWTCVLCQRKVNTAAFALHFRE